MEAKETLLNATEMGTFFVRYCTYVNSKFHNMYKCNMACLIGFKITVQSLNSFIGTPSLKVALLCFISSGLVTAFKLLHKESTVTVDRP